MNTIKFIAMHHAGGLRDDRYAKSQHLTWENINAAHHDRWNFVSSLGYYGGYNFYIEANGSVKQFRAIGEETAAQLSHNFDTISICLAGNFIKANGAPIEIPTKEQKAATCILLGQLLGIERLERPPTYATGTRISIDANSIHHHAFFGQTECDCLSDSFWRKEIAAYSKPSPDATTALPDASFSLIEAIIALLVQLREHLKIVLAPKKLGAVDRECCGHI